MTDWRARANIRANERKALRTRRVNLKDADALGGEHADMATPRITDYGFGRIKVDGESYGKD
ncbi:unnamed protein product, partial [marine sediment metagenome]